MTLEQLKQVVEIASTGSINQAAGNLFISQAALSMSLMNLEKELGHTIFLRNNRGVQLTGFGQDFLSYIRPICTQIEQLEKLCQGGSDSERLAFSIACNGFRFVSLLCSQLYKRYKPLGLHLYIHEGIGDETLDLVSSHQAEIGIMRVWSCYKQSYVRSFISKKLHFTPLVSVPVSISVGEGSPFFSYKNDCIAAEELKDYPMAVYPYLYAGPYADIFARLGLSQSKSCFIAGSRSILYSTLKNTDAYYVSSDLSQVYKKLGETETLRSFALKDCEITSEIGWVRRDDDVLSPIAREFLKELTLLFQG